MAYNPYTAQDINSFIDSKGIANDPWAMHNFAQQYGVDPAALDAARGWSAGTAQGWRDANVKPNGYAQAGGALHDPTIAQTNPQQAYALAMANGWTGGQADSSYGLGAGVAENWAKQQGLTGFGGTPASSGATPAAGGATTTAYPGGGQMTSYPAAQTGGAATSAAAANPYMPSGGGQQRNPYLPFTGSQWNQGGRVGNGWGGQAGDPNMIAAYGGQGGYTQGPQGSSGGLTGNQGLAGAAQYLWQNPNTMAMGNELTRNVNNNLQRNILPGIRGGAMAAGGVGGSRQGVAEGLATGESMAGLAGALANLYGGQYNQDRTYGLQNDALDLSVYNANQNWMRQGQQDQLGFLNQMAGWNQQGLQNANTAAQTPFTNWNQFVGPASQMAGLGGSQSQNLQGNPYLGAIGGYMAGQKLFGG